MMNQAVIFSTWHLLYLSKSDFQKLELILHSLSQDLYKLTCIQATRQKILILGKADQRGKDHVLFAPGTFETLSNTDPRFFDFDDTMPIHSISDIGSLSNYRVLFGDEKYYNSLLNQVISTKKNAS